MLKSCTGTARSMGRWIGFAAAALVVACGGGGSSAVGEPAPPAPEVPTVQAPAPVPAPVLVPVNLGSLAVVAGRPGGSGYLDGNGSEARFQFSNNGVVTDAAGNVFVTDGNAFIRRITPQGQVSTLATGVTGGRALAMDKGGNFFVADERNSRILKVSAAGVVTTYAGSAGEGSVDGPAAVARFLSPQGLALAADGTLYVSEYAGTIRRISPDGVVSTLAGQAHASGDVDGPGAQARFQNPGSLALDAQGLLFVSDNRSVRTVDAAGNVATVARFGNMDGAGSLAVRDGVIYVRSGATGAVLQISGSALAPVAGPGPAGFADGAAADARFAGPGGMAFDGNGNLYFVDGFNNAVRKLDPKGMVSTLAGSPVITGRTDGPAATASFFFPDSLAQDGAANLYVSDKQNNAIRQISNGNVSTFVAVNDGLSLVGPSGLISDREGNLDVLLTGPAVLRHVDATGSLGAAVPTGGEACTPFCFNGYGRGNVVRTGDGAFYVSDPVLNLIRRIEADGRRSVFAGAQQNAMSRYGPNGPGSYPPGTYAVDGTGLAASFDAPSGLALDAAGNLYVADSRNNVIRRITPAGVVSTYAGVAGPPGDADGPAGAARFNFPVGLALDAAGNLYVADRDNALVRKITPMGVVTTVAGQRGKRGVVAGALPATLNRPFGLLLGNQGELYVTDTAEHVILRIALP